MRPAACGTSVHFVIFHRMEVSRANSVGEPTVIVKAARGPDEIFALRREAELLRRAAHPQVIGFVAFDEGDDEAELTTLSMGDVTLDERPPQSVADAAAILAVLADTVADL